MMSRSGLKVGNSLPGRRSGLMAAPRLRGSTAGEGEGGMGAGAGLDSGSGCGAGLDVGADGVADQVGETGGYGAQDQLAEGTAEEGAVGQPGD